MGSNSSSRPVSLVLHDQSADISGQLSRLVRELSLFMRDNRECFTGLDRVIAYYDNGQAMITSLINTVFGAVSFDVEFGKAKPNEHRLFQSADLFCTLDLMRAKADKPVRLTHSEEIFFEGRRRLEDMTDG